MLVVVLATVVIGGTTDLVLDRPTTWRSLHVAFERGIIMMGLIFAVLLWRGWWRAACALGRTQLALAVTRRSLAERQAEQEAWRRRAEVERAGFARAVDAQFTVWGLTPTEREIAFLLLQGRGHKQVAARTSRSERTVRQHAVSIYVTGVAASGAARDVLLLTGIAGLVAGAMSMAAGEYVSVSSQADTEAADAARERRELATDPEHEHQELASIYVARGLAPALAAEVATQLMAHDELGAHQRDELGLTEASAARPLQAALASAGTFASGALLLSSWPCLHRHMGHAARACIGADPARSARRHRGASRRGAHRAYARARCFTMVESEKVLMFASRQSWTPIL
jgi:DNA-binding CsgD family transcriptional regulator